jgi:hypothetical protein
MLLSKPEKHKTPVGYVCKFSVQHPVFKGGKGGDNTDTPLFFSARPLGRVGDLSIFLEAFKAVRKCSKDCLYYITFE